MCYVYPVAFIGQARLDSGCQEAAYAAAKLLGVSPDALAHCLTARKVRAGNTNVTIYLTHEQAAHARDAMSKVGFCLFYVL